MNNHVTPSHEALSVGWPIQLQQVCVGAGRHTILDNITLRLDVSQSPVVILGRNGAGKSQLLRLLNGLLTPDSGSIFWQNSPHPVSLRQQHLMIATQHTPFKRSARSCIMMALRLRQHPEPESRTEAALHYADLSQQADIPASHLSSGQHQRLMLGIAWALQCQTVLLDEPTAHLDPIASQTIESMMVQSQQQGQHQIIISHSVAQAQRLAKTIVFVEQGQLLAVGPAATFFQDHRHHPTINAFWLSADTNERHQG